MKKEKPLWQIWDEWRKKDRYEVWKIIKKAKYPSTINNLKENN